MRYNCKALYTLEEIAEQCRNAIMKAEQPKVDDNLYDEILTFYRWEDDILRLIPEPVAA
jgi:hypothetical protein